MKKNKCELVFGCDACIVPGELLDLAARSAEIWEVDTGELVQHRGCGGNSRQVGPGGYVALRVSTKSGRSVAEATVRPKLLN